MRLILKILVSMFLCGTIPLTSLSDNKIEEANMIIYMFSL